MVEIVEISDTYSEKINTLAEKVNVFLEEKQGVVIVGLSGRFDHWSIVNRVSDTGKTWFMTDSDGIKEINVAKLTTREIPTKDRNIKIDHFELVGLCLAEYADEE